MICSSGKQLLGSFISSLSNKVSRKNDKSFLYGLHDVRYRSFVLIVLLLCFSARYTSINKNKLKHSVAETFLSVFFTVIALASVI